MNRLLLWVLALSFLASLPSCKLYRRVTGRSKTVAVRDTARQTALDSVLYPVDSAVGNNVAATAPDSDPQQQALLNRLMRLWNRQRTWTTFNGKAKAHYEGKGENQVFTATIRMEKGSRIWVSVVALGIMEVARVMVTPDSVQIIDRFHKEYRVIPFNQLGTLLPVRGDFASLQSILIGDPINTSNQPNAAQDSAGTYLISFVSPQLVQTLKFAQADTTLRTQTISAPDVLLLSQYDNYSIEANYPFSNTRRLSMKDKEEQHLIELDFNKTSFNEPVDMSFSVPEKYTRK